MLSAYGNTSAKVMLVAEGGSEEDVSKGYCITGYAESKYRQFCKDNGLHIDEMWKTALIKERINLTDWEANVSLFINQYREVIINEIREIKPNIIIPLGENSFRFFSEFQGIRKYRGSVLPCKFDVSGERPIRVLPILGVNPYFHEDSRNSFVSRLDFGKISRHQDKTNPITEIGNCWIAKNASAFRAFKERHYRNSDLLIFDIETYAGIPTCISFCFDGNESCTVPLIDWNIPLDDRALLFYEVSRLLASNIPKGNQNIKYDWHHLNIWGFYVKNIVCDTNIGAGCIYPEFPKNLGFLTSIYTDMPYHKDEGKTFDPSYNGRDKLYLYCAKDSLSTWKIQEEQKKELVELGTLEVYNKLIQLLPVYKTMEDNGILVNTEIRLNLRAKYENLYEIQLHKLKKLCGKLINPLSPKQVYTLIFEELEFHKIKGVKMTKTLNESGERKASTDEDSLELLAWMGKAKRAPISANEIIKTIVACRKIKKVLEYLSTQLHPDGRMHCSYNLVGTETGRTSASETTDAYLILDKKKKEPKLILKDIGRSFQTISKHGFMVDGETYGRDLRDMYVPTPGFVLVECDLSGAEARVDSVLARDYEMLEVFDGPVGIHKLTGSWVYNCEPSEIKKNTLVLNEQGIGEDRYHVAKTVRHAGERNMQSVRLMMMLHKVEKECARILKRFHDRQPKIREVFHREIEAFIRDNRCLVNPNGRRRDFFSDKIDDHTINEAISQIPQGIVSDQLKFALIPTMANCGTYARLLVEAHDGALAEVRKDRKEEYALEFKKNVETPIDFKNCSLSRDFKLVIPMESDWSEESWQKMKKLEI